MADKFDDGTQAVTEEPAWPEADNRPNEVTDLGHLQGAPVPPTNDMALVSFLAGIGGWIAGAVGMCPLLQGFNLCLLPVAFIAWAAALFSGFIARGQLAERAEGGEDLARWGMVAGGAGIALGSLLLLVVAVLVLVAGLSFGRF